MKFLLFFLSFFCINLTATSLPAEENRDLFLDEVVKGYSTYSIVINEQTAHYDLLVIKGLFNDTPSYGICFTSNEALKYQLIIEYGSGLYNLERNERKDSMAVAIEAKEVITLLIVDSKGNEIHLEQSKLMIFVRSEFNDVNSYEGMNTGGSFSKLYPTRISPPLIKILLFVSSIVIGVCLITLLILYVLRKGLFHKDKRKLGVVNVKEILNSPNNNHIADDFIGPKNSEIQVKVDKNEEKYQIEDIVSYLQELGFDTNYSALNEETKNLIMIELIRLKDEQLISLNDYYKQTQQLWKK